MIVRSQLLPHQRVGLKATSKSDLPDRLPLFHVHQPLGLFELIPAAKHACSFEVSGQKED
jgi:hypothetical protein